VPDEGGGTHTEKTVREERCGIPRQKAPLEITNKDWQVLPEIFTVKATARWKEVLAAYEELRGPFGLPPLYAPAPP